MWSWLLGVGCVVLGCAVAFRLGLRRGRSRERRVADRFIHDTALQALEGIALLAAEGTGDDALYEIRGIARVQAARLRRGIAPTVLGGLGMELAAVVADLAGEGLRVRLVMACADDALPGFRCRAVGDAAREALRNTRKHASTGDAVVEVGERDGGVEVVVCDHGAGFDQAARRPGFGISESIGARLREVGGRSAVVSVPGEGTRVRLWVPR